MPRVPSASWEAGATQAQSAFTLSPSVSDDAGRQQQHGHHAHLHPHQQHQHQQPARADESHPPTLEPHTQAANLDSGDGGEVDEVDEAAARKKAKRRRERRQRSKERRKLAALQLHQQRSPRLALGNTLPPPVVTPSSPSPNHPHPHPHSHSHSPLHSAHSGRQLVLSGGLRACASVRGTLPASGAGMPVASPLSPADVAQHYVTFPFRQDSVHNRMGHGSGVQLVGMVSDAEASDDDDGGGSMLLGLAPDGARRHDEAWLRRLYEREEWEHGRLHEPEYDCCVHRRCGCTRVFYGWFVLAVATLVKIMSAPGQSPCIGVVIEQIRCVCGLCMWVWRCGCGCAWLAHFSFVFCFMPPPAVCFSFFFVCSLSLLFFFPFSLTRCFPFWFRHSADLHLSATQISALYMVSSGVVCVCCFASRRALQPAATPPDPTWRALVDVRSFSSPHQTKTKPCHHCDVAWRGVAQIATCSSSAVLPLMGKAVDVAGPRSMVTVTALALAIACMFMAAVTGPVALGVCFFFLRFLGQGSMVMIGQTEINYWWVRRRGLVMGIGGGLMSLVMVSGVCVHSFFFLLFFLGRDMDGCVALCFYPACGVATAVASAVCVCVCARAWC